MLKTLVEKFILIYVAIPYKHENAEIMLERYNISTRVAAMLIDAFADVVPVAPITYTHVLNEFVDRDVDWYNFDIALLFCCDILLVITIDGWKESYGVQYEIEKAKAANMHIIYADPDEVLEKIDEYRQAA